MTWESEGNGDILVRKKYIVKISKFKDAKKKNRAITEL